MATATASLRGVKLYSIDSAARKLGVSPHKATRVVEARKLGQRVGKYRILTEAELPELEEGLVEAGYLQSHDAPATTAGL